MKRILLISVIVATVFSHIHGSHAEKGTNPSHAKPAALFATPTFEFKPSDDAKAQEFKADRFRIKLKAKRRLQVPIAKVIPAPAELVAYFNVLETQYESTITSNDVLKINHLCERYNAIVTGLPIYFPQV